MVEIICGTKIIRAETNEGLFSPKGLDRGTSLLLDSLDKYIYDSALDWGCGWGAIGLYLAAKRPEATVIALDAHVGAVKTTHENALRNNLENLEVIASDSFDMVDDGLQFDLICSNPPTHMGRALVENMIRQSHNRLNTGCSLVIVVETRLKPWIERALKEHFGSSKMLARTNKNVVLAAKKPV